MQEEFKEIIFNNNYLVSNTGKIMSKFSNNELVGDKNNVGYRRVLLQNKRYFIHRLVAIHFIDNPDNKPCINHIDGDKLNNNVDNLEWCTRSENDLHAFKLSLRPINCRPLPPKKVHQFTKQGELVNTFDSAELAAQSVGGTAKMIRRVCQGHRKYTYNYVWKYSV